MINNPLFTSFSKTLLTIEKKLTGRQFLAVDLADLPLSRTLLAIRQKSREPRFWEVMDSFVLLAQARLAASRTFLQRLLACLNYTLESEDLFFWYKGKK